MDWKYFDHEVTDGEQVAKADPDNCFYDLVPLFVREYGYLPIECQKCWKPLIFWNYSQANVTKFHRLLDSLPVSINGKYNDGVVVFYTDDKGKVARLLALLDKGIRDYGVDGRTQWRVSGNYWQKKYPEFFVSAKELSPAGVTGNGSVREWLRSKRQTIKDELITQVGHPFDPDDDTQVREVLREFKILSKARSLSWRALYSCNHPVAMGIAEYRITPKV